MSFLEVFLNVPYLVIQFVTSPFFVLFFGFALCFVSVLYFFGVVLFGGPYFSGQYRLIVGFLSLLGFWLALALIIFAVNLP